MTDHLNTVTTILAIGAALSPLIIGFFVFKMSSYFVSKNEFGMFRDNQNNQHTENKDRLERIEDDIKTLLGR